MQSSLQNTYERKRVYEMAYHSRQFVFSILTRTMDIQLVPFFVVDGTRIV